MQENNPYKRLAERLDALPNGFPAAPDGSELRLLEKLFTPEEASLAAQLRLTQETPSQIAARLQLSEESGDERQLASQLKAMARKGLIAASRSEDGLVYSLMPFVVGIYEAQLGRVDAELARLFETYYRQSFTQTLPVQPAYHRVVPVQESVKVDLHISPYENVAAIVREAQSWGVLDCICRTQKALIGEGCHHPIDVCMAFGKSPGLFDHSPVIHALTLEGALNTLQRAADAGLVHTVSNVQKEISYICNCCTCSCGILRGVAELGISGVVARSSFVNQVDQERCIGCQECEPYCQFGALSLAETWMEVNPLRCVGCGVCISFCQEAALSLVPRPQEEFSPIPENQADWRVQRSKARGVDLQNVL